MTSPGEEAILSFQEESESCGEVLYPDLLESKNTGNGSLGKNVRNSSSEKAEEKQRNVLRWMSIKKKRQGGEGKNGQYIPKVMKQFWGLLLESMLSI